MKKLAVRKSKQMEDSFFNDEKEDEDFGGLQLFG